MYPQDHKITFKLLTGETIECCWMEISSLSNPMYSGEKSLALALDELDVFDYIIDVGAVNSAYPALFPEMYCVMFDRSINNRETLLRRSISKLVGTGENQERLSDYILPNRRAFVKIDVDGSEIDVLKTITNFTDVSAIQFEYDRHWPENGHKLETIRELLPYQDFYAIHHCGLSIIDDFTNDGMYRNILCGNLDFEAIDREMKKSDLCIVKEEHTSFHTDQSMSFYYHLVNWTNQERSKGNTKKRRHLRNYPLNTFKEVSKNEN